MSHLDPLSQWIETVSTAFPTVEPSSSKGSRFLELWNGTRQSCGIILVCAALAIQLGCSEASLVQRLREWCYGAKTNGGQQAPRTGYQHVFCSPVGLDTQLVARG